MSVNVANWIRKWFNQQKAKEVNMNFRVYCVYARPFDFYGSV